MPLKHLTGVRVLEFTQTVMGPTAGLILAELGADVIKVEPAPNGDKTRRLGGFGAGFFSGLNRNKRGLAIDLKSNEGRKVIHKLVLNTDVVLENFAPGTMERLECGFHDLSRINPRLIYLALKGYLAGPYENRPALDEVVQFQSGLAWMTGPPGQPLRAGASVIDILGAMFGVIGIQAALKERDQSGKGQRVSSSLFESAVFLMGTHMAGMAATGSEARPMPARGRAWAIYDVFETKDSEKLFIGVTSDQQWERFVEEFDLTELSNDPRLSTNPKRVEQREWLLPAVRNSLLDYSRREIEAKSENCKISWAPVGQPGDLFNDPHLLATGGLLDVFVSRFGEETGQTVGLPNLPLEFGETRNRPSLERQPPKVGEHNEEILLEAGFNRDDILKLYSKNILANDATVQK
ncbi:MAG: CaiB/BaiF CoA-transferase family protein [Pseudomonadota bacterium]|nr:CaiB/BaiF CoA-transferase family protein [Pseudomonadota bacterium]